MIKWKGLFLMRITGNDIRRNRKSVSGKQKMERKYGNTMPKT